MVQLRECSWNLSLETTTTFLAPQASESCKEDKILAEPETHTAPKQDKNKRAREDQNTNAKGIQRTRHQEQQDKKRNHQWPSQNKIKSVRDLQNVLTRETLRERERDKKQAQKERKASALLWQPVVQI